MEHITENITEQTMEPTMEPPFVNKKTKEPITPLRAFGVDLYTSKQTAEILGVNCNSIAKYRRKGLLPSLQYKGGKYTSREAIKYFLKETDKRPLF